MSAMRIRAALRRARRNAAVALAVIGLAGAVAAHHDAPDMHGMPAAAICLAVLTAAGAAGAAGVVAVARVDRLRAPVLLGAPRLAWTLPRRRTTARAGPPLSQLQVLRR